MAGCQESMLVTLLEQDRGWQLVFTRWLLLENQCSVRYDEFHLRGGRSPLFLGVRPLAWTGVPKLLFLLRASNRLPSSHSSRSWYSFFRRAILLLVLALKMSTKTLIFLFFGKSKLFLSHRLNYFSSKK